MRSAFVHVLSFFPRFKRVLRTLRDSLVAGASVSANYTKLQGQDAGIEGQRLQNSWQDDALPQRQRKLVDLQLRQYRSGVPIDVFDVFVDSLRALPDLEGMSLLEVGCSS